MTITCPSCGSVDVGMIDHNGAEYPETRVEFYQCRACSDEFKKVLSA